jgi:beta-ribofuranosylaminobenzene 5'-phosphate synthase
MLSVIGGTSGIGVHSYFTGGFIFDLGHKSSTISTLKPSHAVNTASRPLLLSREEMPKWPIGICIPNDINPRTHIEERQFFNDICPLKREAVYETAYHALFGVFASVKAKDYDTFCLAIKNIQNCEWKKAERNVYGKRLKDYENLLYSSGADAVGMSSLGPSLYFMAKNPKLIIDKLNDLPCQFYNAEMVNHGRILNNV